MTGEEFDSRVGKCESLPSFREQVNSDSTNKTSQYAQQSARKLNFMEQLCSTDSIDEKRKLSLSYLESEVIHESETCKVTITPFGWDFDLKYQGTNDYEWQTQQQSSFANYCGIITIATITPHDDSGVLWQYKQQRVVTNPDAHDELMNVSCKERISEPTVYSWDGRNILLSCKSASW